MMQTRGNEDPHHTITNPARVQPHGGAAVRATALSEARGGLVHTNTYIASMYCPVAS